MNVYTAPCLKIWTIAASSTETLETLVAWDHAGLMHHILYWDEISQQQISIGVEIPTLLNVWPCALLIVVEYANALEIDIY